jgi:hypothetical protein
MIHKWREPIPGCFLCIPQGDMVECDDKLWYQNLKKTVRESVDHGNGTTVQQHHRNKAY